MKAAVVVHQRGFVEVCERLRNCGDDFAYCWLILHRKLTNGHRSQCDID